MIVKSLGWKTNERWISSLVLIDTILRTTVLNSYTEQDHASEIDVMYRCISASPKVTVPTVIGFLVEDFVLDIKGKKVLELDGSSQV